MNLNINKFWKKRSVTITEYDPTYKVVYLGNVLTAWAKGEGCVDKPLATLWKNYCQNVKPDVCMKVTICNSGLKAVTKEHGLTEYWSHRITFCGAHAQYPRVFCWVYRHEGKRLRQELRCHAVLCSKEEMAKRMSAQLQQKLTQALQEFKREKICRQNARLSLANSVYDNPSLPRRKILLSTGSINYRPPLERSKSAPKLMVIEEAGESPVGEVTDDRVIKEEDEEEFEERNQKDGQQIGNSRQYCTQRDNYHYLLQERYLLQQRRQQRLRLLTDPTQLEAEDIDNEDRDRTVIDLHHMVTDIDDVALLLDSSLTSEQETTSDIMPDEDYDDNMAAETYTSNPNARSPNGHDHNHNEDEFTSSSSGPSSSSSSPSSTREGRLHKDSKSEEDNISDESGYSEDNSSVHNNGSTRPVYL